MKKIVIIGATVVAVAMVGYLVFEKWASKNTFR